MSAFTPITTGIPCSKCHQFYLWPDIRTSLLAPDSQALCKNCYYPPPAVIPINTFPALASLQAKGMCGQCGRTKFEKGYQLEQKFGDLVLNVCVECWHNPSRGNVRVGDKTPSLNNNYVFVIDTTRWNDLERHRLESLRQEIELRLRAAPDPSPLKRQDTLPLRHVSDEPARGKAIKCKQCFAWSISAVENLERFKGLCGHCFHFNEEMVKALSLNSNNTSQ